MNIIHIYVCNKNDDIDDTLQDKAAGSTLK